MVHCDVVREKIGNRAAEYRNGPALARRVEGLRDKTDLFGDVAVSRGTTEEVVRLANGKELDFSAFWTAVCHKEDGTWKVFRMQATLNPVDNVFVTLQLKKAKLIYGIGGLIAGALLILVIRCLLCKRRKI